MAIQREFNVNISRLINLKLSFSFEALAKGQCQNWWRNKDCPEKSCIFFLRLVFILPVFFPLQSLIEGNKKDLPHRAYLREGYLT